MSTGSNVGCRRDLAQDIAVATGPNGGKLPGCDNGTGVIFTWGLDGGTTSVPGPSNQTTTPVPDPSTLLLVATGLIGGVVRMRQLMARS